MELPQSLLDFVSRHENDDVNALRLKYSGNKASLLDFSLDFALLQIEARKKSKKKIPSFVENPNFIFPSLFAAEQSTNEAVARFHASLIAPGSKVLDLTAGLGIDDMSFASAGALVTSCEIDSDKCDALRHNAAHLNINVICNDSIEYLKNIKDQFDVIFADPARRGSEGKRLHALSDCSPDILGNLPLIMKHSERLLVKSSPLLDLSLIINSIENLSHIFLVCFRGECKEVLIDIQNGASLSGVTCLDLDWNHSISLFTVGPSYIITNSNSTTLHYGLEYTKNIIYADHTYPIDYKYIYEPNAAVMKTGAWAAMQMKFPLLHKADANTHLFFSDMLYDNFPGRVLQIESLPDKKSLKKLKGRKINVVVRNYPLTPQQIADKYGIISAGNSYLYAFRFRNSPTLLIANQL